MTRGVVQYIATVVFVSIPCLYAGYSIGLERGKLDAGVAAAEHAACLADRTTLEADAKRALGFVHDAQQLADRALWALCTLNGRDVAGAQCDDVAAENRRALKGGP